LEGWDIFTRQAAPPQGTFVFFRAWDRRKPERARESVTDALNTEPYIAHRTPEGLIVQAHGSGWCAVAPTLEVEETVHEHAFITENAERHAAPIAWEVFSKGWGDPPKAGAYSPCKAERWEGGEWREYATETFGGGLPLLLRGEVEATLRGMSEQARRRGTSPAELPVLRKNSGWVIALNEKVPRLNPGVPIAAFVLHDQTEEFSILLGQRAEAHAPIFGVHCQKGESQEVVGAKGAAAIMRATRTAPQAMLVAFGVEGRAEAAREAAALLRSRGRVAVAAKLMAPEDARRAERPGNRSTVMSPVVEQLVRGFAAQQRESPEGEEAAVAEVSCDSEAIATSYRPPRHASWRWATAVTKLIRRMERALIVADRITVLRAVAFSGSDSASRATTSPSESPTTVPSSNSRSGSAFGKHSAKSAAEFATEPVNSTPPLPSPWMLPMVPLLSMKEM